MFVLPFRHRRFGYVVLNVSDIEKTTAFATEVFGLDRADEGSDGQRFLRCSPKHYDIKGLHVCGLDMNSLWSGAGPTNGAFHSQNMTFGYIIGRSLAGAGDVSVTSPQGVAA